jgi:hypothetical protein
MLEISRGKTVYWDENLRRELSDEIFGLARKITRHSLHRSQISKDL